MTIIIFIIVLAVLIIVHELGHFLFAKTRGIRVDEFGLGFPPRIWGYKPKGGETLYSLNSIPFGGFVRIFGENPLEADEISGADKKRSFAHKSRWTQASVLFGGVLFNFIFAWLLFSLGFLSGLPYAETGRYADRVEEPRVLITNVLADSPAAQVGFLPGDEILFVESKTSSLQDGELSVPNIVGAIQRSQGNPLTILVRRGDTTFNGTPTPEVGIVGEEYGIGIAMTKAGTLQLPVHHAIAEGFRLTVSMTKDVTVGLFGVIYDAVSGNGGLSNLTGPVGVAGLVGDASRLGFVHLLSFTAFISIHLAVLNLIPFPALDGGRLLFLAIEGVRRRRISPKVFAVVNTIGFALLMMLLLVVTYKDIARLL